MFVLIMLDTRECGGITTEIFCGILKEKDGPLLGPSFSEVSAGEVGELRSEASSLSGPIIAAEEQGSRIVASQNGCNFRNEMNMMIGQFIREVLPPRYYSMGSRNIRRGHSGISSKREY